MKILITGGAGFIGSQIADRYLEMGHDVIILDDLSSGRRENVPSRARFYETSLIGDEADGIVTKEKPDIVNHHAAQIDIRKSASDPLRDAEINILGTLKLLETCRRNAVKKLIFASSGGAIYGDQDYFPADEKHPCKPANPYGIAKFAGEKYLQFYHRMHGLPFVTLRYANVYGPRQNALGEAGVISIFSSRLLKGEAPLIFGDGLQTRDFVYVGDVVECNAAALQPDVQGIFNVGTGIETDVKTLAQELIRMIGLDLPPQHAPARAEEQSRSSIKPGGLQKQAPTPLAVGLQKTVEWFSSLQK